MTREIDVLCAIKRTVAPELEAILGHAFPVLDHGFVRVIDYMGDDAAIVQMARTSYGEGTKSVSDDRGLIRYLMRHAHTSPFEGCEIKLHVKLPVFVARQWIRHRMANVNEVSGRYSVLPGEFYFPDADRLGIQSKMNKQGTGAGYSTDDATIILDMMNNVVDHSDGAYRLMVASEEDGGYDTSREQARIVLPLNIYTEWYWKIDLHNLFHFLKLRSDPHAQWEIREYADVICKMVEQWVPSAFGAWADYKRDAVTFSRMEMEFIKQVIPLGIIHKSFPDELVAEFGLSKREAAALLLKLGGPTAN